METARRGFPVPRRSRVAPHAARAALRPRRASDRASTRCVAYPAVATAICGRARTAARALAVANQLQPLLSAAARAPRRLVLVPAERDAARARELLAQHGLERRRFIHLHPGSCLLNESSTTE